MSYLIYILKKLSLTLVIPYLIYILKKLFNFYFSNSLFKIDSNNPLFNFYFRNYSFS